MMQTMVNHTTDNILGFPLGYDHHDPVHKPPKRSLSTAPKSSTAPPPRKASKQRSRWTKLAHTIRRKFTSSGETLPVRPIEKVFRIMFSNGQGEKLIRACQCYLWTTVGPISGFLFISSDKLAFCSHEPMRISSSNGEGQSAGFYYKVVVPLRKIKEANQSESVEDKMSRKYLQVVTKDGFEFWFLGLADYRTAFATTLRKIIS